MDCLPVSQSKNPANMFARWSLSGAIAVEYGKPGVQQGGCGGGITWEGSNGLTGWLLDGDILQLS
jgi:hypothetical protein